MSDQPIDLDDLQAVAELSRLSWEPHNEDEWFTRDGLLFGQYSFDVPDSDYIEAVPPAAVLALVAELQESRATVDRVKGVLGEYLDPDDTHIECREDGWRFIRDLRAALKPPSPQIDPAEPSASNSVPGIEAQG